MKTIPSGVDHSLAAVVLRVTIGTQTSSRLARCSVRRSSRSVSMRPDSRS
jgi:hypothetical protein